MRRNLVLLTLIGGVAAACSDAGSGASGPSTKADAPPTARSAMPQPPQPAQGLWEVTMSNPSLPQPVVHKICQGPAKPGENPFNKPEPGVDCSSNTVTPTLGGATFSSVCEVQGMTIRTDGRVTGDFAAAYKVELAAKTTGPNIPPGMADMRMTIDAKRLGDCPAGMAPDTIVP